MLCYKGYLQISDQSPHCNLQTTMQGEFSKTGNDKFEEMVCTFKIIPFLMP